MLFSVNASLTIWPVPCHVDEDDGGSYHLLGVTMYQALRWSHSVIITFNLVNNSNGVN